MAQGVEIIEVELARREEAAMVLLDAFEDDPLAIFIMRGAYAPYSDFMYWDYLYELFRFSCSVRLHLGWPLKGALLDGKLVGVAGYTMPDGGEWPPLLEEIYDRLKWFLGPKSSGQLEEYSRIADEMRPRERHYHLGMVGVHPSAQGRGIARALIEPLHALSESDPLSTGVALDTENPKNVPLYEHLGYHVTGERNLGEITIWAMFRPNGAASR
jgi:GNAT superfamily N-acetyltransferase